MNQILRKFIEPYHRFLQILGQDDLRDNARAFVVALEFSRTRVRVRLISCRHRRRVIVLVLRFPLALSLSPRSPKVKRLKSTSATRWRRDVRIGDAPMKARCGKILMWIFLQFFFYFLGWSRQVWISSTVIVASTNEARTSAIDAAASSGCG